MRHQSPQTAEAELMLESKNPAVWASQCPDPIRESDVTGLNRLD